MNSVSIHGIITSDAEKILIKTNTGETPLIIFTLCDLGLPYQKKEPLSIEVHFLKEAANHIFDYLKKDKEVIVSGFLKQRVYQTAAGETRSKLYISADFVTLVPLFK